MLVVVWYIFNLIQYYYNQLILKMDIDIGLIELIYFIVHVFHFIPNPHKVTKSVIITTKFH
jgi:hypothetical protein